MFIVTAVMTQILVSSLGISDPLEMVLTNVSIANSPDLLCKKIEIAMVYDQPTTDAKVLGRTQDFVAVTGKEVNGFYPIITGTKVRGWIMVNQTFHGKSFEARPCKVQVLRDGRLLFEQ